MDFLFLATKSGGRTFERRSGAWHQVAHTLAAREVTSGSAQGNTLLAGTTGGVFRSTDLGQTWRPASEGLTTSHVRWVSYHPEKRGVGLVGTEPAAIFRTEDDARTWQECPEVAHLREENGWFLPYSPQAGCVRGFAFHGDRAYAAVEQGGLLRSDDGGQTWRLAEGSNGNPHESLPRGFVHDDVHSVAVHSSSPDLVVAPTGGGVYRSEDGGNTWTEIYDCYCRGVWLDGDDPDHLIAGPADGVSKRGRIEASSDGGASWHPVSDGLDTPWPEHMVDRFARWGDDLLAVLSNGHLMAASLDDLAWRRLLPEIDDVLAVAVMEASKE